MAESIAATPAHILRVEKANIAGALPAASRMVLDVELDLLPFLERVELPRREGRVVEKDLAAVLGSNEAEPSVSDQAHNRTRSHSVSLPHRSEERGAGAECR